MRFGRAASSAEILTSPLLRQLHAQARLLARLDALVVERLTVLKNACRVAAYQDGVLTLSTTNSALAGQIRYMQASLLGNLRQCPEFDGIRQIRVINCEPAPLKKPVREPLPPISPSVGKLLRETADLLDDAELSEAFRRLASHASDKPTSSNK
jgi:hypothetical protein